MTLILTRSLLEKCNVVVVAAAAAAPAKAALE